MLAVITVTSLSSIAASDGVVTLGEAIEAANTDSSVDGSAAGSGADTIEFAPNLAGVVSITSELVISSDLTIEGPGADIIEINGNDTTRIFNVTSTAEAVAIRGLALTNARGPSTGETRGGAIFSANTNQPLILEDLVISDSISVGDGGAIYQSASALNVINSTLSGNSSSGFGGALASGSGPLTINNSTIENNTAVSGGGGINAETNTTVDRSTVSGNRTSGADAVGAGIRSTLGGAISNSTISGNITEGTNGDGGGIYFNATTGADPLSISNSTISGNVADARGGGFFHAGGRIEITNSTITANIANSQTVDDQGGGFTANSNVNTETELTSSIVAGNFPSDIDNVGVVNTITSLGFNLIGNGSGLENINQTGDQVNVADAMLGGLVDNGGPTLTHALLDGSPAIDAGNPSFDVTTLPNDQRGIGFSRVVNVIDIGAFEVEPPSPPTISLVDDQNSLINTPITVNFTVDDAQTLAGSLTVVATSSNQQLVPNTSLTIGGSLADRTLTLIPNTNELGTSEITITVTDASGLSAMSSFTFNVSTQIVEGQVFFDADGNGVQDATEVGVFGVVAYIDENDNEIRDANELFTTTNSIGQYRFENLLPGEHVVRIEAPGGRAQSSPTSFFGTGFVTDPSATQLFELSQDGLVQPIGSPTSAQIHDLVRTNDGTIIGIDALTNGIYSIDPVTGQDTLLAASVQDLSFGLAYDPATDTIFTLVAEPNTIAQMRLHTVNPVTGQLSAPIGLGLAGLEDVSDLAFDTVNNRIIGFDNSDDQFFEFLPDGTGQILSTADRLLDSRSLAFNGTTFVMFDQPDITNTGTFEVDPDTGEVIDGFSASQSVATEGLFHSTRGNSPHIVTLSASEIISDLQFGLAIDNVTPQASDFPVVINELLIDPPNNNDDSDQFIELRGVPGGQLNSNTYFVIVEESGANPGQISGIFDLSDQPLGQNGFLVLLQQGNIYQPDPQSAVLESTTQGFGGLPGGIFSDDNLFSNQIDTGSNAYFLIESNVAPVIGDDIDVNDNGFADPGGIRSNWNVLDSLSIHPEFPSANFAYGQILLAESDPIQDPNLRSVIPGTPIVVADGFGYAGRIGDSVGSSPDDWVFGSVAVAEQIGFNTPLLYELDSGFSTSTEPRAFQLRNLDHVGDSNFVGGVRGTIQIAPELGVNDFAGNPLTIQPASGLVVFADTNNNGQQDLITHIADPDSVVGFFDPFNPPGNAINAPLSNAFPGVTVTAVDNTNEPIDSEIQASLQTGFMSPLTTPNFVYSDQGDALFSDDQRLRFDFYEPVTQASIDAIGLETGFMPSVGILEAYDANGILIASASSSLLVGPVLQTITVNSPIENIAYVVAYADTNIFNTAPVRFDRLTYQQLEASAFTDSNGQYEIKNLFPGTYDISVLETVASEGLVGETPRRIVIDRFENFIFNDTLRPNAAPTVEQGTTFTVDENAAVDTIIGSINAEDLDRQQLQFELVSDVSNSGLILNPDSGELSVGPLTDLDFESQPEITLVISVTDSIDVATTLVTISLNDLNEAPVVEDIVFFVAEDTVNGSVAGQVQAIDPDLSQNQQLSFELLGGTGADIFSLNPANGVITLIDDSGIDFESSSELNLLIRVSDNANPPLSVDIDQTIQITDQNDPPFLATTAFTVPENSVGIVGQLFASDPDIGQTHIFELLGGTGVELFDVQRNGSIEVRDGAEINFEQNESYTLQVIAIDSGAPPLANEGLVTLTILDLNEAPSFEQAGAELAENSPAGTAVATLTVIDPENSGSAYSVTLLPGADGANFDFDPSTNQLTVADGADLDFESNAVNEVRFLIVDPTGVDPVTEVSFFVNLTDQNDPPIVLTEEIILSELAVPGTIVGQVEVQVREPDNGDVVTTEIVGGNAADLFVIDSETRILRVADGAQFDADGTQEPLVLNIQVTDEGGLSSVGTIQMILNDVDEPPVFSGLPFLTPPVGSGEPFEFVIPADAILDPEGGDFSIAIFDESGQLPQWLEFDEATRTLSGLPTPELLGTFPLTIRAFQPGPLELFNETSLDVVVQLGDTPLTNGRDPLDVDANGQVAAIDALRVVNFIGINGSGVPAGEQNAFNGFVDTSGDGFVTALDALLVINALNQETPFAGEFIANNDADDRDDANDDALLELLQESLLF